MKPSNKNVRSWLLALSAGIALSFTHSAPAGTTSTTFSFQQGDLRQDGGLHGSGASYAGVVDGRVTDNTATSPLSTGVTATLGNQNVAAGSPNGQQHCGLFSYDLTELNSFIAANTSASSSVTVTSVSFKLISSSVGSGGAMALNLYGTDPFTSSASGCTWSNYTTATPWTIPYQSGRTETAYNFTGGPSALTASLGGTSPTTGTSTTPIGTTLTWTSSANFITTLTNALVRPDKTLHLTARGSFFSNSDNRVNVNTSPATTVDNRPELLITLDVTTVSPAETWTGASSNSWIVAGNWNPSGVPGVGAPITFDSLSTANLATVLNQDFDILGLTVTSPSGPVSIGGANTLTVQGDGINLSGATQNLTITAPLAVGAAQSWDVASGRTLGISGAVSGSPNVTVTGAGKVSLGAANILPNGVSAGNLAVNGTLDLNGTSQSVNGLSGAGTIIDNTAAGTVALTIGNNDAAGTFSGIIQDTGGALAMVKTGAKGSLTLTGANDFSGGFTNNGAGNVTPNSNLAFGTGPVVSNAGQLFATATTTFANTLALNGSTLRIGGGNSRTITWNGAVTATGISGLSADSGTAGITLGSTLNIAGATFNSFANGTTNNIIGDISGAGGNLNVTGGTLQLSGTGSYNGTTTLSNSGVLRLQATGTISSSSNVVINGIGNFNIRNTAGWVYTGTISGDGTGSVNLNTGTNATLAGPISGVTVITSNNAGTDATVSGNITGAVGVTATGGGILTLAGNNSALSGAIALSAATAGTQLNVKSATALGTGTLTISGGTGRLDNTSGSALTLSTNNPQAWNSNITFVGTDALNLGTGAVTMAGNRTLSVTNTLTVGGNISDGGSGYGITKNGWGTLVLTGASTYTGATAIAQWSLSIDSIKDYGVASAIGAPLSGDIRLGNADDYCNLIYTGSGDSTNRTVKLGNDTPANNGVGSIRNNGSGPLTFTATNFNPAIPGITANRTLWLAGTYTGGDNGIQGIIQDHDTTGAVSVGKANDASIWVLSGANTYTGGTIVQGGTLKLGAAGSIASSAAVNINAGATLDTTAKGTYATGAQPLAFGIDATGSGSSGKIAAAGLNVGSAVVTYNITGTPDDPVYVLATYTGTLTGTFASVDAPPVGYTLNYAYQGNKIALVQGVVASGYDAWKTQITNGLDLRTDDADGDGFNNLQEFLFGTTPIAGNGSLVTTTASGGNLVLRWLQRETGATYALKQSATLAAGSWTTVASPVPALDGVQTGAPTDYDYFTVTLPTTGGGKSFFRIEGVEN